MPCRLQSSLESGSRARGRVSRGGGDDVASCLGNEVRWLWAALIGIPSSMVTLLRDGTRSLGNMSSRCSSIPISI